MYTTVGLCIGTVTAVHKLETFGKTFSLVCCCRTSSCSCMPGALCWWTPEQKVGVKKPGNSKSIVTSASP